MSFYLKIFVSSSNYNTTLQGFGGFPSNRSPFCSELFVRNIVIWHLEAARRRTKTRSTELQEEDQYWPCCSTKPQTMTEKGSVLRGVGGWKDHLNCIWECFRAVLSGKVSELSYQHLLFDSSRQSYCSWLVEKEISLVQKVHGSSCSNHGCEIVKLVCPLQKSDPSM